MKVLITSGPTWVAIDAMRVISNRSTGEMGRLIAEGFKKSGAQVTLIEGQVTEPLKLQGVKVIKFTFFNELAQALKIECAKKYDVIVHAAAVSDFKPERALKVKIGSDAPFNLRLVPTAKLIGQIKALAPDALLVGFKLESSLDAAFKGAKALFTKAGCDLVVANTTVGGYKGSIVDADGKVLAQASDKKKIATALVGLLK